MQRKQTKLSRPNLSGTKWVPTPYWTGALYGYSYFDAAETRSDKDWLADTAGAATLATAADALVFAAVATDCTHSTVAMSMRVRSGHQVTPTSRVV